MSASWQWLVVGPILLASLACAAWMLCPASLRSRLARRWRLPAPRDGCTGCKGRE